MSSGLLVGDSPASLAGGKRRSRHFRSPRATGVAPQCYGSGAPGRKFFEDIAATPELLSPSKCPGAEPGTHASSSFGSANQKTTWFSSVRTPVMLLKAKASSMMASTRTCPLPAAFVVKSPIYSTAPNGGTGSSVRKSANVVLGRRPSACRSRVSTPRLSSLGKTETVAAGFGIEVQFAMASEAGTRSKLNGLWSCAYAVWMTGTSVDSKPKAAMTVERMFELITDCLVFICLSCLGLVSVLFLWRVCFVPVHVRKRTGGLKPAMTA